MTDQIDAKNPLVPGFYWARRRDDDKLTVVRVVNETGSIWGPWVETIGSLRCPGIAEAGEHLTILERIAEPSTGGE